MSDEPYVTTAFVQRPHEFNHVYGTIGKLLYIGVWLFSLASPLVLLSLVWFQLRTWALAFGICMLAPFFLEFHTVPALRRYFAAALAHPSMEFCFEGETFPTARGNVDKADPRARQPVLFCFHPHGIFPQGWGFAFLNDKFRNTRFLMARALFTSPFFRVLAQLTGKPSSADKATMTLHMKKGHDIALIPGGFEEASIHSTHCDRLFLKHRQGFIKYALQFGYSVCPVYSFGERESYSNAPGFYKFRLFLNSWGLPGILPWGKWWCPLLPRDVQLKLVVGEPLHLPLIFAPTAQNVDEWHAKYIDRVRELFERHKRPQDTKLEIW